MAFIGNFFLPPSHLGFSMFLVLDKRLRFDLRYSSEGWPEVTAQRATTWSVWGLGLVPARWLYWPCASLRFWLEGPGGTSVRQGVTALPGPTQTVVPLVLVDLQRPEFGRDTS